MMEARVSLTSTFVALAIAIALALALAGSVGLIGSVTIA